MAKTKEHQIHFMIYLTAKHEVCYSQKVWMSIRYWLSGPCSAVNEAELHFPVPNQ